MKYQVLEPAAEYLQEDVSNKADQRLPPEVTYMLKSIRYSFVRYAVPIITIC